jgi:hypothetical protein
LKNGLKYHENIMEVNEGVMIIGATELKDFLVPTFAGLLGTLFGFIYSWRVNKAKIILKGDLTADDQSYIVEIINVRNYSISIRGCFVEFTNGTSIEMWPYKEYINECDNEIKRKPHTIPGKGYLLMTAWVYNTPQKLDSYF